MHWFFCFPFQWLPFVLLVLSKEIFQFSLLNENFNLLLQVITLICVISVISVEATVITFILFVGISFHLFWPFQGLVVFDLRQHLVKWSIQGSVVGISSWRWSCLPAISISFLPHLGLLWTRALPWMVYITSFRSFSLLLFLGNNCILNIHEILSWVYQLDHRQWLLVIQFVDE